MKKTKPTETTNRKPKYNEPGYVRPNERYSNRAIVAYVMRQTGFPRHECKTILHSMYEFIHRTLGAGKQVNLYGLGSFTFRMRKSRTILGRLQKDSVFVRFAPSSLLKKTLKGVDPKCVVIPKRAPISTKFTEARHIAVPPAVVSPAKSASDPAEPPCSEPAKFSHPNDAETRPAFEPTNANTATSSI